MLSGKPRKGGASMQKVIRKSAKKKRQFLNAYGEKKKKPRGPISGAPKLAETGRVDGFPVRGNRA
jgi:hypothetical protein